MEIFCSEALLRDQAFRESKSVSFHLAPWLSIVEYLEIKRVQLLGTCQNTFLSQAAQIIWLPSILFCGHEAPLNSSTANFCANTKTPPAGVRCSGRSGFGLQMLAGHLLRRVNDSVGAKASLQHQFQFLVAYAIAFSAVMKIERLVGDFIF